MVKSKLVNSPHNRQFTLGTCLFDHFWSRQISKGQKRHTDFLLDLKVKYGKYGCPKTEPLKMGPE
jgi:hypothetical protein